jgi:hypothetical protein
MNLKTIIPTLAFNYDIDRKGVLTNLDTLAVLQPCLNSRGYMTYGLRDLSHKYGAYTCTRARLLALAYIPNPLNLPEVDHLDNSKTNDVVENLEWVTRQENIRREYERVGRRYTPFEDILKYRTRHAAGETWRQIKDAEGYTIKTDTFADMVKTRRE